MAEKASGGESRKSKKGDGPGLGHNLTEIKKKALPALKEILGKFDDMESDMGSYRAEIKDLYEKHANALGVPRKLVRMLVSEARAGIRTEAALAEMEADERDQLETLQASLGETPFGKYFAEKLGSSKPASTANGKDK